MQFTNTIFSLLVASVMALPAAVDDTKATTITVCGEANFAGCCQTLAAPLSTCNTLPANLTNAVSSVRPAEGYQCLLLQGHCNANAPFVGEIYYPGIPDLSTLSFDNKATTFICLEQPKSMKGLGVSRVVGEIAQIGRLIVPGHSRLEIPGLEY